MLLPAATLCLLGSADFRNPLFWAVLIGWIMSVVLHEFAHGLVAHLGGDYTIGERGGLSLNPIQYIDPVFSLLMPAIFLAMGGVPLPGGVTYVNRDLLRNKWWDSAVSLAGPAMNFLLAVIGVIALHPKTGWIPLESTVNTWTPAQLVVASLTILQLYAVMLNLIPVPPLDGFGIIAPFLKPQTRLKMTTPPTSIGLMFMLFVVAFSAPVQAKFVQGIVHILSLVGFQDGDIIQLRSAFSVTLFGK